MKRLTVRGMPHKRIVGTTAARIYSSTSPELTPAMGVFIWKRAVVKETSFQASESHCRDLPSRRPNTAAAPTRMTRAMKRIVFITFQIFSFFGTIFTVL